FLREPTRSGVFARSPLGASVVGSRTRQAAHCRLETVDDCVEAARDALAHILVREDVETAAQHMGERDLGDLVRGEGRIAHGALQVLLARRAGRRTGTGPTRRWAPSSSSARGAGIRKA